MTAARDERTGSIEGNVIECNGSAGNGSERDRSGRSHAGRCRAVAALLALVVALLGLPIVTVSARAESPAATVLVSKTAVFEFVPDFGRNPGHLGMYSYRPAGLRPGAPVVVELHGCAETASGYFAASGWRTFADRYGFALVLAEQSPLNNPSGCFNWYVPSDTTRGHGEAASIASMIDYSVRAYGSNPSRVYVTGLSAGAAMTAVMLATYPDKLAGGSISAGMPYRCATNPLSAIVCGQPGVDRTPKQWGDLVRAASPWTGARPRVAVWQGTLDPVVNPRNAGEQRDQFTDVARLSQTPTATGAIGLFVRWEDYAGKVRIYRVAGMGHATPVRPGPKPTACGVVGAFVPAPVCAAYYDTKFFGLDGSAPGSLPR